MIDLAQRNIEAHKYAQQFRNTFGFGLNNFWDPFLGFNVVKFDKWLNVPLNVSCGDVVAERYGAEAVALIKKLIKL